MLRHTIDCPVCHHFVVLSSEDTEKLVVLGACHHCLTEIALSWQLPVVAEPESEPKATKGAPKK